MGPGDFRIREKIAKSLGLLALAERAQVNTVPIGADGQRSGGIHAGGLGRGLHGAGACGTRTSRLRGEHPQRAVIAENRIGVDNGVG